MQTQLQLNCSLWFSNIMTFKARNKKNLLDPGIIHKGMSPWASPIVEAKKKTTPEGFPQQFCLCVDYRKLNSLLPAVTPAIGTRKGALTLMPLPKFNELFTLLEGAKYFTAPGLCSGYYHIKSAEEFTTAFGKFKLLLLLLLADLLSLWTRLNIWLRSTFRMFSIYGQHPNV